MDKLKSQLDRLCVLLSRDPEYILNQCGDILSMNEYKEVEKQSSGSEKTKVLLKIIDQKGEDAWRSFADILGKHQGHYPQLQQLLNPEAAGSFKPAVFADGSSLVSAREITNTTVKSISSQIEIRSQPGSSSSGNHLPRADYTACDGSVICTDKISGVNVDGDINFSVCLNSSQVNSGAVQDTQPSPQGPAVAKLRGCKVKLIDCLMVDLFILQYAYEKGILCERQYRNLKHSSPPEQTIINLIDYVIGKGQDNCVEFLELLKKPEICETYPKLKEIIY